MINKELFLAVIAAQTAKLAPQLSTKDGTYTPVQGAAFVHTGKSNSHNYAIGAVCVFDRGDSDFDLTTSEGSWHNHASLYKCDVRPATAAEIEKLWPFANKIVGYVFGDAFEKPLTDDNLADIVDYL